MAPRHDGRYGQIADGAWRAGVSVAADARVTLLAPRDELDVVHAAHPVPPGQLLTVERQTVGRRMVLAVNGEVDLDSAPHLGSAIESAFDAGAQEVWIDLSTTTFMDSAGVHLLIAAHQQARDLRRRLAVICPRGPARRVLGLSGEADALPLYEDRDAAHRDG